MKHLVPVILLSAAATARADTVVLTGYTSPYPYASSSSPIGPDYCYLSGGCSPFNILIPQFDPTLGTLTSITWAFTDSQEYYGGYNDMYDPLIGDPFTWTTTGGDASDLLGLSVSNTQVNSSYTTGCSQISLGGWWFYNPLEATGAVPDDSPFVGTGMVNVPITPFVSASVPTSSNGWVRAAIDSTMDDATLTLTETYTAIPEPRGLLVLLLLGLAMAGFKVGRQTRPSC